MRISRVVMVAVAALSLSTAARAELLIRVDKAAQVMTVTVDGAQLYAWPVSTGLASYDTPNGNFKPFRMEKDHFSREWDDAPMPFSIFFTQAGHAIHGSGHAKNLGRPASHGCVRLSVANAKTLFALVKTEKMANTRVVLVNDIPMANELVARRGDSRDLGSEQPRIYNDEENFTGALPPRRDLRVSRDGWQEIPADDLPPRYRRVYRDPPPYYPRRYGSPFPFGW
ncbi:MAG: L,D-transpeptidase [Pseudolabrys sp.]